MTETSRNATTAAPPAKPPLQLIQQITGYRTSQCIRAVVELGIPALLHESPQPVSSLAAKTKSRDDLLLRVLDHLVDAGIFGKDDNGFYALTETSRALVPNRPGSLHDWIACELHPLYWRSWENIVEQLKSGAPAFELAHGKAFFEWLSNDSKAQKRFDNQMRGASVAMGSVAVRHLSFVDGTAIIDIGGGDGSLLAQVLENNPGTTGILFELHREQARYHPLFQKQIDAGIASVQNGSFFDTIPAGGQAYLFSRIFHDFDDEAVRRILRNTRSAMRGHERLFIIDIMPSGTGRLPGWSSQDVFMMVQLGGRERVPEEFSTLLEVNGFATVSITPTQSPLTILEFRPS